MPDSRECYNSTECCNSTRPRVLQLNTFGYATHQHSRGCNQTVRLMQLSSGSLRSGSSSHVRQSRVLQLITLLQHNTIESATAPHNRECYSSTKSRVLQLSAVETAICNIILKRQERVSADATELWKLSRMLHLNIIEFG